MKLANKILIFVGFAVVIALAAREFNQVNACLNSGKAWIEHQCIQK